MQCAFTGNTKKAEPFSEIFYFSEKTFVFSLKPSVFSAYDRGQFGVTVSIQARSGRTMRLANQLEIVKPSATGRGLIRHL